MNNPYLVNNDPEAPVPLTFLVKDFPVGRHCQWLQRVPARAARRQHRLGQGHRRDAWPQPVQARGRPGEFTLKVFKDGQQIDTIKIGVAKTNTPTPGGIYYTTELIKTPNPDGDYGPYAYGLSGYSDTLTSFNGGPGPARHPRHQRAAAPRHPGQPRLHPHEQRRHHQLADELPLGTPVQINT